MERSNCPVRVIFQPLPRSRTYDRRQQHFVGTQFPRPSDKPPQARENLQEIDCPDSESTGQRGEQSLKDRIHRTDGHSNRIQHNSVPRLRENSCTRL